MNVQFRAQGKQGEIWLYDQIGQSWFGDGITAKQFQKELSALGRVDAINLRINSPGGDVFDGLAIYNQLKSHPARKTVDIDGLAASIASVIAMAGDEIRIAGNAMMMIHNPHGMAVGDSTEMQRVSALLEQVKVNLAETYSVRTGNTRAQLEQLMQDETWMNSETAVLYGFADAVTSEQRVSACFGQLSNYRNVPDKLRPARQEQATPMRDMTSVRIAAQYDRMRALGVRD